MYYNNMGLYNRFLTGLIVDINEVICGDPSCAPVDTVFTFIWESGGKGVFAIPLGADEITQDDLIDFFPVCFVNI